VAVGTPGREYTGTVAKTPDATPAVVVRFGEMLGDVAAGGVGGKTVLGVPGETGAVELGGAGSAMDGRLVGSRAAHHGCEASKAPTIPASSITALAVGCRLVQSAKAVTVATPPDLRLRPGSGPSPFGGRDSMMRRISCRGSIRRSIALSFSALCAPVPPQ
jgi:hypothetical protein